MYPIWNQSVSNMEPKCIQNGTTMYTTLLNNKAGTNERKRL